MINQAIEKICCLTIHIKAESMVAAISKQRKHPQIAPITHLVNINKKSQPAVIK